MESTVIQDRAAGAAHVPLDPRLPWAAERTLLAWVRTGVAMMGFGFVVARFGVFLRQLAAIGEHAVPPSIDTTYAGVGLVALGMVVNVVAAVRHRRTLRTLGTHGHVEVGAGSGIAIAMGAALIGAILAIVLLSAVLAR
jgi:putative membrane protein